MLFGRFYLRIFSSLLLALVFSNEVLANHKYDGPDMPALRAAAAAGDIEQIDILVKRITDRVLVQQRIVRKDGFGRDDPDISQPRQLLDNTEVEFFGVIGEAVRTNQVATTFHLVEVVGHAVGLLTLYQGDKYKLENIQFRTAGSTYFAIREAMRQGKDEVLEAFLVKHYQDPERAYWHFRHDEMKEVAFNATLDPETYLRVFRLLIKHGALIPWQWITSQHGSLALVQACLDLADANSQLKNLPESLLATHLQVKHMRLAAADGRLDEFDDAWDGLNAITLELARGLVLTRTEGYSFEEIPVEGRPHTFQNSPVMLLGNELAKQLAKKAKRSGTNPDLVAHVYDRLKTDVQKYESARRLQTEYPQLQKDIFAAAEKDRFGYDEPVGLRQPWARIKELGEASVGKNRAAEVFTRSLVVGALRKLVYFDHYVNEKAVRLIFELVRRDCPQHLPVLIEALPKQFHRLIETK